jgi:GAF domain-containing protein/HAMP domain-containing protein
MNQQQKSTDKVNIQAIASALPLWRQLRWSLLLYFVALAVIPLAIVITIVLNQAGQQAEAQISRQLESVAELKIDQIDQWLSDSDLALDFFLSIPVQNKLVAFVTAATLDQSERDQLNRLFSEMLARHHHDDEAHPENQEHTRFLELFVYNPKGDIVAASDPSRVGQIVANQPYFAASLTRDLVQSPFYELGQSELTMIITKPLWDDRSNQIVGVLAGRLDLNTLSKIMIGRAGLGETGETYLVSLENNYLVTSSRFESEGYTRTRAYHSEGIDRALRGENGSAIYTGYREPAATVIGVYRWLPNLKVGLLAEVEEAEALASFATVRNFSFGVAFAAILLAIGVGLYSAARISRPIVSLTQATNRIAGGDLTQQAKISEGNEIGLLAAAFNSMTDQLRELFGVLEDRNRRLEIAANLGEHLSAILNLEELLAATVNQVKDAFGYYHAHIYLLDEGRENLIVVEGTGAAGAEMKARRHSIPLNAPTSLVACAARTDEIVKVDNTRRAADWLVDPLSPDTQAEIAVPITLDGQVVGVLDVQSDQVAGLDEGDVNLLRLVADQVAVGIRNARQFAEAQAALAATHAAQEHYQQQAWEKVKSRSRLGRHHYARPDASKLDEVTLIAARRQALAQPRPAIITRNGEGLTAQAIVAPVNLAGKAIGNLQLHRTGTQPWTDQDLALIEAVLDQVAQTAENLRLFDETQERAGRERTIREISDKLRAAPTLDMLLETAARELGQRLSVRHTVLELGLDPEQNGRSE